MESHIAKYPGVHVHMEGHSYVVPSLSVRQFRKHYEVLVAPIAADQSIADFILQRVPVIGDALRRNYPDLTDETLEDMIDMANFNELLRAVQGASGMKAAPAGESTPVPAK